MFINNMNYIGKFISNFRDFYNEINAATLTGAIDVVVVEQPDGSFTCSPFHVRFGKLGVLRSREKIVDIEINGEPLDIHMKLGESGEAFFVEEVYPNEEGDDDEIPPHLACSPIPSQDQIENWMKEHDESKKNYFDWENNNGDIDNQLARVFAAETITNDDDDLRNREKVRKISIAVGEFKTIETQECEEGEEVKEEGCDNNNEKSRKDNNNEVPGKKDSSEGNISTNSSSNSLNQLKFSAEQKQSGGGGGGGGKRKRRKKSMRKKNSISNNFNNSNDVSDNSKDNISGDLSVQKMQDGFAPVYSRSEMDNVPKKTSTPVSIPISNIKEGQLNHRKSGSSDSLNEISRLPLNNDPDFHFFSDTELTPGCSIIEEGLRSALVISPESLEDAMPLFVPESRPCSPIVSDTEIEQRRHEEESHSSPAVVSQSWKWGELPSPILRSQQTSKSEVGAEQTDEDAMKKQQQEEAQRSMLSGMFSFMKKTKHLRHNNQAEGIYLSDLNSEELDPEVAALYFPHSYRGETKQGEGHNEEDAESGNGPSIPHSPNSQSPHTVGGVNEIWNHPGKSLDVSMSLCGHLDSGLTEELFGQFMVSYDDFVTNPMLIENPDLVVQIDGKYYNWRTACPLVMSMSLYGKSLPQPVIDMLSNELMPPQQIKKVQASESTRSYSSWFYWRRTSESKSNQKNNPDDLVKTEVEVFAAKEEVRDVSSEPPQHQQELPLIEDKTEKEEKEEGYAGSNSSEDSDNGQQKPLTKIPRERRYYQQGLSDKFRKTLRLSSEQIASLNLQEGANEVVFSVTTAYQGTTRCKCHIYKWRHDDRIVISDIDGTITKSDVLGHILPIVGKDWAQSGVAQLFTKIKNNGYKLLYLSARAIGQARVTRDYLKSIKQGDLSLPDGPLLLNPTSLISAFHREVIEKKPEEFKISCLRDIAALFPPDVKPFYAGYGNRVNDVWAYRAVGIPIVRIFTINYKGELKHELTQTFQSSYTNMCHLVDEMFPPPPEDLSEDFSNFAFWRDPIQELSPDQLTEAEAKQESRNK